MTESTAKLDVFAYNADHQRIDTWEAATYADGGGVRDDGTGKVVAPTGFATHVHATLDSADKLTGAKTTRASSDADANRVSDLAYSYDVASPWPCPGTAPAGIVHTLVRQSVTDNITGQLTSY